LYNRPEIAAVPSGLSPTPLIIKTLLSMKNISEMEKQILLAAQEATSAYTAVYNHSFRSMDCTTTIIRKLFNDKFTCSQTKCMYY
jgi:hypothetical protein